jgi:hypothetical protein
VQNVQLTFTHAALRAAPVYVLFLWGLAGPAVALASGNPSVGAAGTPWWVSLLPAVRSMWILANLSAYYTSDDGRALHDHLARTVVVLKGPDVITAADAMPTQPRGLLR